jgi:hypothetical protein
MHAAFLFVHRVLLEVHHQSSACKILNVVQRILCTVIDRPLDNITVHMIV